MKIAAIVVTCNRKEMVSDLLDDLFSQSRRPDGIIVVDNGSEDGTAAHLKERFPSIHLVALNSNDGHMPSFELSVKTAFEQDYDAVVSIDDDARLKDDTLECLLQAAESNEEMKNSVIWCANITPDGECFTEPVCLKEGDEWNIHKKFSPEIQGQVFESLGGANIGIYIPRVVYEKIGPPWGILTFNGEPELKYRIERGGFKMYYCLSSVIYHKPHEFSKVVLFGKTRFVSQVPPWNTYYELRNRIYIDRYYKRRTLIKNIAITALDSLVKIYASDRKITTLFYLMRAVIDGFMGNMGMTVKIPRAVHGGKS